MSASPDGGRGMMRIAVLVSGRGRNLQAMIEAVQDRRIHGTIVGVLADRPEALALERARASSIPDLVVARRDYAQQEGFDAALAEVLEGLSPDLIVLAGFMRILGHRFVSRFGDRMINIHPSLLPLHRGLGTHQRALDAADREHGATVHLVNNDLDDGARIIQGAVSVLRQDDAQALAERVMTDVEIKILPQTVAWLANGRLQLHHGSIIFDGIALQQPLSLSDLDPEFS